MINKKHTHKTEASSIDIYLADLVEFVPVGYTNVNECQTTCDEMISYL